MAPTLRFGAVQECSTAARHHCAAHSEQSLPRQLVPCIYFSQAVPSSRGRPPAIVLAPPSSWSMSFTLRRVLQVLWLWAGPSPTATSCLFYVPSQYFGYASRSSTSTGAAWWIPGGGQRARTTRRGTRRSSCSAKGRYSPPRFTTSRHDAISFKAVTLWNRGFIQFVWFGCCSLLTVLFSGLLLFSFLLRFSLSFFLSLSFCSLFFCVRCRWFVGLLALRPSLCRLLLSRLKKILFQIS